MPTQSPIDMVRTPDQTWVTIPTPSCSAHSEQSDDPQSLSLMWMSVWHGPTCRIETWISVADSGGSVTGCRLNGSPWEWRCQAGKRVFFNCGRMG